MIEIGAGIGTFSEFLLASRRVERLVAIEPAVNTFPHLEKRFAGNRRVDVRQGYKQAIADWAFSGVTPPISVEVSDPIQLSTQPSKVCYVLRVGESDLAPHFLNGRKGVYVRTDEFSSRFEVQLANESELSGLMQRRERVVERRDSLVRRSRDRFQAFAASHYDDLGRRPASGMGAWLDLSIGPRFPMQTVCDHSRLIAVLQNVRIRWRQVDFPRTHHHGLVSQHESVIGLDPGSSFSLLEANTWGMLYYATEIELEHNEPTTGIHVYHFVGQLLVFLEHARLILGGLGYTGPLTLHMRMKSMRNVPWLYTSSGNTIQTGPASPLDDGAEVSLDATTEDLQQARDSLLKDLMRAAFYATNWVAAVTQERLDHYVDGGYRYNFWNTSRSGRP